MTFVEFRAEVLQARARKAGRIVGELVRFPGTTPKKSREERASFDRTSAMFIGVWILWSLMVFGRP